MSKKKSLPFESIDIFENYTPAPASIKKAVFARILPLKYVKPMLFSIFLLFLSPILLVIFDPDILQDKELFSAIVSTTCALFVLFSGLGGFILVLVRIPNFQEIKEWLGYTE